ncbi:hypothetical protein BrnaMpl_p2 (mitochondrion) [Brassica napus]|uniref:Orf2 protein n=1 Tax=Brassica napus TaxID=3708 RepID=Q8HD78_BRANA|nr:hypothetical protein BrnaMpl_p2 [Brassica napus]BAC16365.1 orf2 [Brassica napus]
MKNLNNILLLIRSYWKDHLPSKVLDDENQYLSKTEDEIFHLRLCNLIHVVHTRLNEDYDCYKLTSGEIYEILDLVYNKKYVIDNMKLVEKMSEEGKNDFCELEGEVYRLPSINNQIIRRFPVDLIVQSLPNVSYFSKDLVSPDIRYIDKGTNFIKSSFSDTVVITAFILVFIKSITEELTFFRKSCYLKYQTDDEFISFNETLDKWGGLNNFIVISLHKTIYSYSKSRVLEKVAPLVNSDHYLMSILNSLIYNQILDEEGKDYSYPIGSPLIPILDNVLSNIFLDDLDQKIEDQFPHIQYARYQHIMVLSKPTTDKEVFDNTLNQIFLDIQISPYYISNIDINQILPYFMEEQNCVSK